MTTIVNTALYSEMGRTSTRRSASTAAGHTRTPWHSGVLRWGLYRHSVEEELKRFAVPMMGCELDGSTCSG